VGQLGFYDLDKRLEAISAKGDPLEALKVLIPFESFRVAAVAARQGAGRQWSGLAKIAAKGTRSVTSSCSARGELGR
jgi:hypothetical protein